MREWPRRWCLDRRRLSLLLTNLGKAPLLPLRILFWNQEYAPSLGGVELYTQTLAEALTRRGNAVAVVTAHSNPDLPRFCEIGGVAIHRMPFFQALSSRNPEAIAAVRAQIVELKRTFRPNLVHVNFTDASPFFHLRTRAQHDISVIALHHACDRFRSAIPLAEALAARAQSVVAPSQFLAENFKRTVRGTDDKVQVILNGVDEDFGSIIPKIDDRAAPLFLFAGRLAPEKGADLLVDAASNLSARGIPVRFAIAGAGPELAWLKDKASKSNVMHLFDYVGWLGRAALARAFVEATAVIVPSIGPEAFGLIAAEAAMAGRPVIAARSGALPEIVEDRKTGLLFESGNALDLTNAMARLIAEPDRGARLGAAARLRAQERFGLSGMVDRYEHLYARLVGSVAHAAK